MKLLYGQAFRAPNSYELFWRQDGRRQAEPGVAAGNEQHLGVGARADSADFRVRVGVTGFHYRVDDLISQQTDPFDDLLVYNNVDRIDAQRA